MSKHPSADQALALLMAGNRRHVSDKHAHPNRSASRRGEVIERQEPFAVILGCADSRVPTAVVFDQGIGDLFVVRIAGNLVDDLVLGSIEYAIEHLHVPLVVVLGHSRCGAIAAAFDRHARGHIATLVNALQPAIANAKHPPGDQIANAIDANIRIAVATIATSEPIIAPKEKNAASKLSARDMTWKLGLLKSLRRNRAHESR
jgi:carbonic anhydrase